MNRDDLFEKYIILEKPIEIAVAKAGYKKGDNQHSQRHGNSRSFGRRPVLPRGFTKFAVSEENAGGWNDSYFWRRRSPN